MRREIVVAYLCNGCERPGVTKVMIKHTAYTRPAILINNAMSSKRCQHCQAPSNFLTNRNCIEADDDYVEEFITKYVCENPISYLTN